MAAACSPDFRESRTVSYQLLLYAHSSVYDGNSSTDSLRYAVSHHIIKGDKFQVGGGVEYLKTTKNNAPYSIRLETCLVR